MKKSGKDPRMEIVDPTESFLLLIGNLAVFEGGASFCSGKIMQE